MYRKTRFKKYTANDNERASNASSAGAIDLNPMLDVIFILLIFFIVTASFIFESGVPEYSGDKQKQNLVETKSISLRINGLGRFFVEDRPVSQNALRAVVKHLLAVHGPNTAVVLHAETGSAVAAYVSAVDSLRQASVKNIGLSVSEI